MQENFLDRLNFDNSYATLPVKFYERVLPVPVANPKLVLFNYKLANSLGIDAGNIDANVAAQVFSGNKIPAKAKPIAMAYAGHQFGGFVPSLGDGRAHLLGEIIDPSGKRWDIHLKGSGKTPFSRRGDGRSPLGPVLREYIISEAMFALGVPTTRSLAVVSTGEKIFRETELPGGILTRIASSHIRVGTFEYFSAQGDIDSIKSLADYAISRLYPEVAQAENPYFSFLEAVMERQARLVAKWMQIGFIHGVMNTDNMAISGETIDYGPCAFMNVYSPDTVFSSIDIHGRYAYGEQSYVAQWNLARFAETLLPLFDTDIQKAIKKAERAVQNFIPLFDKIWLESMGHKIGLSTISNDDKSLIDEILSIMNEQKMDFTQTFTKLTKGVAGDRVAAEPSLLSWMSKWQARLKEENNALSVMQKANPVYIPRNNLVEAAISSAVEDQDLSKVVELLEIIAAPFTERQGFETYALPTHDYGYKTFCGT